jgi:hypothetical protein
MMASGLEVAALSFHPFSMPPHDQKNQRILEFPLMIAVRGFRRGAINGTILATAAAIGG